jgi:hypothetical protein
MNRFNEYLNSVKRRLIVIISYPFKKSGRKEKHQCAQNESRRYKFHISPPFSFPYINIIQIFIKSYRFLKRGEK